MYKNKAGVVPKHKYSNSIHGGGGVIINHAQNQHQSIIADSMGKTHTQGFGAKNVVLPLGITSP